ncbi:MAG TPA: NINE protein [Ktedonobacterales bacterium]|nr:NINE protein [Ktedonobacterales bacterium]
MSVDITRLAAHLTPQQQEAVKKAYSAHAENETAVFLFCFFLGIFGAHRFYLHQWRSGFLHLLLPAAIAVIVVGGLLANINIAIVAIIALPFLLIALIWWLLDLFRIDGEVGSHNLTLAEQIISKELLADKTVETQARAKLAELEHETTAPAAGAATYEATTVTRISDEPARDRGAEEQHREKPQHWSTTEEIPAAAAALAGEAAAHDIVTRTHDETAYSVTDSVETHYVTAPEAPLSAAEVAAPDKPAVWPMPDETTSPLVMEAPPTATEAEASTWPDHPPVHFAEDALAAGTVAAAMTPRETEDPFAVSGVRDTTDLGLATSVLPVADIALLDATPQYVALPESGSTLQAEPAPRSAAGDALLFMVPDVAGSAVAAGAAGAPAPTFAEAAPERAGEPIAATSFVPPTISLADIPPTPSETPVVAPVAAYGTPAPQPEPSQAPLAGAMALGGVAAAEALAHHETPMESASTGAPDLASAGEAASPHRLKRRIRETIQVVEDGKVVDEATAEALIDPDDDPEPVRQRLREQLHRESAARRQSQKSGE